jgi:hypothetical protein
VGRPSTGQYGEFSSAPSTRLDPGRLEQRIHCGEYECDEDAAMQHFSEKKKTTNKQKGKRQAGHVYQKEENLTPEADKK